MAFSQCCGRVIHTQRVGWLRMLEVRSTRSFLPSQHITASSASVTLSPRFHTSRISTSIGSDDSTTRSLRQLVSDSQHLQTLSSRSEQASEVKALRKSLGLYRLLDHDELKSFTKELNAVSDAAETDGRDDEHLTLGTGHWNVARTKIRSHVEHNIDQIRTNDLEPQTLLKTLQRESQQKMKGKGKALEAEGHSLKKTYEFPSWERGLEFINAANSIITSQDHHPAIHLRLNPSSQCAEITITTYTHTPRRPFSSLRESKVEGEAHTESTSAGSAVPPPAPGITRKDVLLAWELDRLDEKM